MRYKRIKKMPGSGGGMPTGRMDWAGWFAHQKKVSESRVAKKEKRKENRRLNQRAMER